MPESASYSYLQNIPFSELACTYLEALLAADRNSAHQIITDALNHGLSIRDLYLGVFQPVQQ
jgi:hypothetical protein